MKREGRREGVGMDKFYKGNGKASEYSYGQSLQDAAENKDLSTRLPMPKPPLSLAVRI